MPPSPAQSPLAVLPESGETVLRPEVGALIAAAYDPVLPAGGGGCLPCAEALCPDAGGGVMQAGATLVAMATLGGVTLYAALLLSFLALAFTAVARGQRFRHMKGAGRKARNWLLLVLVAGFAAGRMAKRSEFQLASAPGAALVLAGIGVALALRALVQGLRRDLQHNGALSRGLETTIWAVALGMTGAVLWWVWQLMAGTPA